MVGAEGVRFCGPIHGPGAGYYDRHDQRYGDQPLGPLTAAQAVSLYRADLVGSLEEAGAAGDELRAALTALAGHDLACWCPLDGQPCHADVLLELAAVQW